ncbi:HAD family hydrolase [Chloroflexota bacterium]
MTDSGKPKAILFDLDDTIIAFTVVSGALWLELCHRFAPNIEGFEAEQLMKAIDKAKNWYWSDPERHRRGRLSLIAARRELVLLAFSDLGINDTETANSLADAYSNEREEQATLFPGAVDTLIHFQNSGTKLALVTNGSSEFQRRKIERYNLEPFFDHIQIEGEFGAGKPEEKVFINALKQLDVAPQEAWMVGDNLEWDVGAAQQAGIYGIWVDWQNEGLPESAAVRPDRIINNISELV